MVQVAGLKDRLGDFTRTGPTVQMHMSGIYKEGGGQSLDLGLSWDRAGPEEPEERKGRGLAGLPAAFQPSLPTLPQEGASWAGAGRAGPLSVSNAGLLRTPHLPHAPLTPTQLSRLCSRMHPEGALLGRPQSTLQTLVGWEPPGPRGGEGGDRFRTRPGQVTGP